MCLVQSCVKFIVFIFNFVFLLVGGALIAVGVFYLVNFRDVTDAIPDENYKIGLMPILTVVIGSIIFVISFFGCCGAVRGSPCLLTTYAVILLVIFILQIALGIFAFLEVKDERDLKTTVDKEIDTLFRKSDNASLEVINVIQSSLKCCGTYGPEFWLSLFKPIPASCHKDEKTSLLPYTSGCQSKFFEFLKDAAKIIGIVVLALAATEVIGAIFSLCLANSVKNELRRSAYY